MNGIRSRDYWETDIFSIDNDDAICEIGSDSNTPNWE